MMSDTLLPIAETDRRSAVSRRLFLAGVPLLLSACAGGGAHQVAKLVSDPRRDPYYVSMYGPLPDEQFPVPAVDLRQIDPKYFRSEVDYPTEEVPGTIVIEPHDKYLYLVMENGRAMRYGIGVGREGFGWSGRAVIRRKAEWPSWHPPVEMQERDEKAKLWANGMPGGLANPLGARAHYLYQGNVDTLYRIHGTNEPWTIGSNVSSGCIRMINQDVIDLYGRVPVGTEVAVLEGNPYYS